MCYVVSIAQVLSILSFQMENLAVIQSRRETGKDRTSASVDDSALIPRLVPGESTCGILRGEIRTPERKRRSHSEKCSKVRLESMLYVHFMQFMKLCFAHTASCR